jgi:hypothetical protein
MVGLLCIYIRAGHVSPSFRHCTEEYPDIALLGLSRLKETALPFIQTYRCQKARLLSHYWDDGYVLHAQLSAKEELRAQSQPSSLPPSEIIRAIGVRATLNRLCASSPQ